METRVVKYKEYREEIMNCVENYHDDSDNFLGKTKKRDTSTILPMDQVIEKLVIDKNDLKRRKKQKINFILKHVFIGLGIALIILAFIIIGIYLFK